MYFRIPDNLPGERQPRSSSNGDPTPRRHGLLSYPGTVEEANEGRPLLFRPSQSARVYPLPHSSLGGFHSSPAGAFLGEALPQTVLKRAGFTTERWADGKAPALIQAALEQSRVLRPFIANKLGKVDISKNYRHYGSDDEFVHAYVKLNKINAPFDFTQGVDGPRARVFRPPHGLDSPSTAYTLRRSTPNGDHQVLVAGVWRFLWRVHGQGCRTVLHKSRS